MGERFAGAGEADGDLADFGLGGELGFAGLDDVEVLAGFAAGAEGFAFGYGDVVAEGDDDGDLVAGEAGEHIDVGVVEILGGGFGGVFVGEVAGAEYADGDDGAAFYFAGDAAFYQPGEAAAVVGEH